jgi:hypothetical protein
MATGVMSSGGGAGESAKIAVRKLALRRRETRRIGQQKSSEKLSQFCACQQRGQGSHSRPNESRGVKLFYLDINNLNNYSKASSRPPSRRRNALSPYSDSAVQNPRK